MNPGQIVSLLNWVYRRAETLPAVANHAHALGLRLAVELGALLQVFLATNTLRVAKAGLGKCISITPGYIIR